MLNVYLVDRTQYDHVDLYGAAQILPAEELMRVRGLSHTTDRIMATGDRMILRILLSMFSIGTPKRLSIRRDLAGKPYLENIPLHFNVSHSDSLLAIALSTTPVGVDVERISTSTEVSVIAGTAFASDEVAWLESMDDMRRVRKFTELWSLKEAHLKRLGVGIAGGLTRLKCVRSGRRFVLESEDPPANYFSLMCARHTLAISTTCLHPPRLHSLLLTSVANKPKLIRTQLSQPWRRHPVRYDSSDVAALSKVSEDQKNNMPE